MEDHKLYLKDSYVNEFDAAVVGVRGTEVALDHTAFFTGGGGQPNDRGHLVVAGASVEVSDVREEDGVAWHEVPADAQFAVGDEVRGILDWDFRFGVMRAHSAAHALQAVVEREFGAKVTGFNIDAPLTFRNDFAIEAVPPDLKARLEELVNEELRRDRAITVSFLPPGTAPDARLVRSSANRVPAGVELRVVEIEGLDAQLDGGTHVRSTGEVGVVRIRKVESKGRANKRVRVEVHDA